MTAINRPEQLQVQYTNTQQNNIQNKIINFLEEKTGKKEISSTDVKVHHFVIEDEIYQQKLFNDPVFMEKLEDFFHLLVRNGDQDLKNEVIDHFSMIMENIPSSCCGFSKDFTFSLKIISIFNRNARYLFRIEGCTQKLNDKITRVFEREKEYKALKIQTVNLLGIALIGAAGSIYTTVEEDCDKKEVSSYIQTFLQTGFTAATTFLTKNMYDRTNNFELQPTKINIKNTDLCLEMIKIMKNNYIGPAQWSTLLDVEVDTVALPGNIKAILNSKCPFSEGKQTVGQTHALILLPDSLDGSPIRMKDLKQIMSKNLEQPDDSIQISGPGTSCNFSSGDHFYNLSVNQTKWILLYKGRESLVPGSRKKTLAEQEQLIPENYRMMNIAELATAAFIYYRATGEKLFQNTEDLVDGEIKYNLPSWTICADDYEGEFALKQRKPTFGGWTEGGLQINKNGGPEDRFKNNGITVCRELPIENLESSQV